MDLDEDGIGLNWMRRTEVVVSAVDDGGKNGWGGSKQPRKRRAYKAFRGAVTYVQRTVNARRVDCARRDRGLRVTRSSARAR